MKKARHIIALKNGKICLKFNSLHAAERAGFSRNSISQCCRGIFKQYNGYIWKFADAVVNAAERWEESKS